MDIFEAIEKRKSYRNPFKNQPVPKDDLIKIVEAGQKAPSGKNAQTTTFVIVDQQELVRTIASMHQLNKAVQTAQAFIACIVNKTPQPVYQGMSFEIEDCAAAVENMLLAITALGYSSVWIDGWLKAENRSDKIGKLLNLPESKTIQVLLPVGIASEDYPQPAKMPFNQRAWFNSYPKQQT